jgi:putative DNA methylase
MQVYSKYSRVETISGEPVPVREALIEINHIITEYHRSEQGELDASSQFCVEWLREYGYAEGEYGSAEVLSQAKNVAMDSPSLSGLLSAGGGRVKLLRMDEFSPERPLSGGMTAWEGCMRMAYHFAREDGRTFDGAADVARSLSGLDGGVDSVERLARILYAYFDSRNDSANATAFNALATSWQEILVRMQTPSSERLL